MPDIAMCPRANCPVSAICRRSPHSGTKPGVWQAWHEWPALGRDGCEGFYPKEKNDAAK